jgi:hypothetical protein
MCHPQGVRLYLVSYISVWLCIHTSTYYTEVSHTATDYTEFYQPKPKVACNTGGTDVLPEDGTQLAKHVEAAK